MAADEIGLAIDSSVPQTEEVALTSARGWREGCNGSLRLSDGEPKMVFVDRGYRGVEVERAQVWRSGQNRGVTHGLKAMIRRRSAIEPPIGHMKSDGKLSRNWPKGALGDAIHAAPCGAGHHLRLIINKLKANRQPGPIY